MDLKTGILKANVPYNIKEIMKTLDQKQSKYRASFLTPKNQHLIPTMFENYQKSYVRVYYKNKPKHLGIDITKARP